MTSHKLIKFEKYLMGTGLYKLSTRGDCCETKYDYVWDIDMLNYERGLENLSQFKGKKLLFLTFASGNARSDDFLKMFKDQRANLEENNI